MIRIETSKRRGVDNQQDADIPEPHRRWFRRLSQLHPGAIQRTEPSALFNCHGLTFACRRSKITNRLNIDRILADDAWLAVDLAQVLPGDIVIYYDDEGDPNHSGVVVEYSKDTLVPIICSKWGYAGEYLHKVNDTPNFYGPQTKFYRCRL